MIYTNEKLQIEIHEGYVLIISGRYIVVCFILIKTSDKVLNFWSIIISYSIDCLLKSGFHLSVALLKSFCHVTKKSL